MATRHASSELESRPMLKHCGVNGGPRFNPRLASRFKNRLSEGSVYTLSGFDVTRSSPKYRLSDALSRPLQC
ncbi:hypothetical protein Bca52824_039169 [Brassica carinata]|uniref:Uncharacterized protein n=1 Tax=Brassica carinata TaxID=52824 RepID=A0A8X7UUC0_BRACI|nr:hypothetical protein Bca52824_039169 [Brassica carinata]